MHGRIFLVLTVVAVIAGAGINLSTTMRPTQAQTDPFPVVLTMTGPAAAVAGQEVTYLVQYELTDPVTKPSTAIVISFTQGATFVSTQVTSGTPGVLGQHGERDFRWSDLGNSTAADGEIEMVFRIDADFRGSVFSNAHVPGTETTSSNIVETQVFEQGLLPAAGGGTLGGGFLSDVTLALLTLAGLVLLCTGAAAHLMRRFG